MLWTIAVAIWLGPSRQADPQAMARAAVVLTTVSTLSGAAIVLALTAILVGLQMLSQFGSRASRMVSTRPVGAFMAVAALLGVVVPLWAAAEPWPWLQTVGLAGFSWAILALGVASSMTLTHLNARWLAIRCISRLHRPLAAGWKPAREDLHEAQSMLLEIAAATDGDIAGHEAFRAIAYVGLAEHRLSSRSDGLAELTETLGARARSTASKGDSPLPVAGTLSLIGLVADDQDVTMSVMKQHSDLAVDSIEQRRESVVRALLDEAAGFATERLHTLLEPAAIAWLRQQKGVGGDHGGFVADTNGTPTTGEEPTSIDRFDRRTVLAWIDNPRPAPRSDAPIVAALLPPPSVAGLTGELVPEVILVESRAGDDAKTRFIADKKEERLVVADLGEYLSDGEQAEVDADGDEVGVRSELERRRAQTIRTRQFEAFDLFEATIDALAAACAAPGPEDHGWPGGWRGSEAFATDIDRIAAPSLALYKSGRYPPTDRAEAAIEELARRLVQSQSSESSSAEPPDPAGWRMGASPLQRSALKDATAAMRELAIEAWHAGFARRTLLTVRRLTAVFSALVERGEPQRVEEVADNLRFTVNRIVHSTETSIAERERSRQFVLGLAVEFPTLATAVERNEDDSLWQTVVGVLGSIGWSPRGSAVETATEVYLNFLAGFGACNGASDVGDPWDVVSWGRHPSSSPKQLPTKAREHLLSELKFSATDDQSGVALLAVTALWRDAIVDGSSQRIDEFRHALDEQILDRGRRSFSVQELWDPSESDKELPPHLDGPPVHWRLFDVSQAARKWADTQADADASAEVVLPAVKTPDRNLIEMFEVFGASRLVNERDYWGVEHDDERMVLIEETDGSRRLLRDCECRAREQVGWGYGGTGPDKLASILVADALGPLASCPSCFGTIGAAAGLIECPICHGGMRPELWNLQNACNSLVTVLAQSPIPPVTGSPAPPGAQWHIKRTDLLDYLMHETAAETPDERQSRCPNQARPSCGESRSPT